MMCLPPTGRSSKKRPKHKQRRRQHMIDFSGMFTMTSKSIMPSLFGTPKPTSKKSAPKHGAKKMRKDLDDGTDWPLIRAFVGIALIATGFLALGLFGPDLAASFVDYLNSTMEGM